MLSRVVTGGRQPQEDGRDGPLLEMTDSHTEEPTPSTARGADEAEEEEGRRGGDDAMEEPGDVDLASVITQVQSRDQQRPPGPADGGGGGQYGSGGGDDERGAGEEGEVRGNWKSRFRCVLRCGGRAGAA